MKPYTARPEQCFALTFRDPSSLNNPSKPFRNFFSLSPKKYRRLSPKLALTLVESSRCELCKSLLVSPSDRLLCVPRHHWAKDELCQTSVFSSHHRLGSFCPVVLEVNALCGAQGRLLFLTGPLVVRLFTSSTKVCLDLLLLFVLHAGYCYSSTRRVMKHRG